MPVCRLRRGPGSDLLRRLDGGRLELVPLASAVGLYETARPGLKETDRQAAQTIFLRSLTRRSHRRLGQPPRRSTTTPTQSAQLLQSDRAREPVNQLVGCRTSDEEEEQQQTAAFKASPKSTEGDNLMVIRLVAVDHAEVAQ